jgi:hypothetical protein
MGVAFFSNSFVDGNRSEMKTIMENPFMETFSTSFVHHGIPFN